MKVTIDGKEYQAATAVELIDEIKDMHWHVNSTTDAEGYISIQQDTYKRMIEREMVLPSGDTEARAVAMFEAVAKTGAWEYEKGGD